MPTIKDVATRAGVGVGTASRVIADKGSYSEKSAQRVWQAVEELDFRPSHAARALLTGLSQTIGVYMPLIKGAFYAPILHAISNALSDAGRYMVVAFGQTLENERKEALQGAEFLINRGCDGLLIIATSLQQKDIDTLSRRQPKLAILNRHFPSFANQCFYPDHKKAGALAAGTLLAAGHRHIALIEGPQTSLDHQARLRGFEATLRKAGIQPDTLVHERGDFSPESGWQAAARLFSGAHKFSAIFCTNDEMAIGALSYLQKVGISVPRDVSVMGYDGIEFGAFSAPPLTTVQIPWNDIAIDALNHLLNQCYETDLPVIRNRPATVEWRESLVQITS